jgi:hypothetical protein
MPLGNSKNSYFDMANILISTQVASTQINASVEISRRSSDL